MVAQSDVIELEEKLAAMRAGESVGETLTKGKACNEMLQEILSVVQRIDRQLDRFFGGRGN